MRQKLTIFFLTCMCLSMGKVCSQNSGMYVWGEVNNSGKMLVEGQVAIKADSSYNKEGGGVINEGGEIILGQGIEYQSAESIDGMLWNNNSNNSSPMGKLVYLTPESQKKVQVRKREMRTGEWYFVSFPFRIKIGDILAANPGIDEVYCRFYDSQRRANTNSINGNWGPYMTANEYLEPMTGYVFAYSEVSNPVTEVVFPIDPNYNPDMIHQDVKKKNVTYWTSTVPNAPHIEEACGWNCLGSPYTSRYFLNSESTGTDGNDVTVHVHQRTNFNAYRSENLKLLSQVGKKLNIRPFSLTFYKLYKDQVPADSTITFGQTYSYFHTDQGILLRSSSADQELRAVDIRLLGTGADNSCSLYLSDIFSDLPTSDDVQKMLSTADVSEIWFREKNLDLGVLTLPERSVSPTDSLQLVVKFGKPGNYTLSAENIYPAGSMTFLELYDKKLDIRTDLLSGKCSLVNEAAATHYNRFYLLVGSKNTISISSGIDGNVEVRKTLDIYARNGSVYVKGLSGGDRVYVYDSVGKLLGSANAAGEEVVIPVSAKGLCIVKVTGSVQEVKKVFN